LYKFYANFYEFLNTSLFEGYPQDF